MSYVLGSDDVALHFADQVEYRPAGLRHAVDLDASTNANATAVGYAACGKPVHVWPQEAFNQDTANLHDDCRSIIRALSAR